MRDAQLAAPAPNVQPVAVRRLAAAAAAGSDRGRSKAARIREPLCQQRRSEPASGERAPGRRSEHVATAMRRHGQIGASPSVDEVADAVVRATTPNRWPHARTRQRQFPQQAPAPLPASSRFDRSSAERRTRRRRSAPRAAASRARRHRHRHRADESAGWHERRARELPRDERALLAHGTAGADSGRRADSRRNEARPGVRRDAARRVLPSPVDAGRPHATASISSSDSIRSATPVCATR